MEMEYKKDSKNMEEKVRELPSTLAKLVASFVIDTYTENKRLIYAEALDYMYQPDGGFARFLKQRIEARMHGTLDAHEFSKTLLDEKCPWNVDIWGEKHNPQKCLDEHKDTEWKNGTYIQSYCKRGIDAPSIGQQLVVRIALFYITPKWYRTYIRQRSRRRIILIEN